MNVGEIESLLSAIGCNRIRMRPGWVVASCPLARWKHGGSDKKPSFAISIGPGSRCRCLGCNYKGSPSELLWKLEALGVRIDKGLHELIRMTNAPDLSAMSKRLAATTAYGTPPKEVAGIKVSARVEVPDDLPVLPDAALEPLRQLPAEPMDYLGRRGLTRETLDEWEIGWHPGARRVAIPVRDCKKRLVGITGRGIDLYSVPKYLHSTGFKRDYYLYGEHKVPSGGSETGYLVEGMFDALWLWQHGYRYPVAMLGSYLSRFQTEKLVKMFSSVVIVPDGDDAGYEAAERASFSLGKRIHVRTAKVPRGRDPAELTSTELSEILAS